MAVGEQSRLKKGPIHWRDTVRPLSPLEEET